MMPCKLVAFVLFLGLAASAPTTYDQRQDGDLNVKVNLDNFVILVARPSSSSSSSGFDLFGSMAQLLADAKRAQVIEDSGESEEATKSTDYQEETASKPEVLVVVQEADKVTDNVARTLRNLKEKKLQKSKYKFVDSVEQPQNLKLVGDSVENCGPGRSRDHLGICQGDTSSAGA